MQVKEDDYYDPLREQIQKREQEREVLVAQIKEESKRKEAGETVVLKPAPTVVVEE